MLANETVGATELIEELRRLDADVDATYLVVRPGEPGRHRAADVHGALQLWDATAAAAQARLDATLETLTRRA